MKSLQLPKPHLICVVGLPGSGKTFFAEQFSETFSAPFLHVDALTQLLNDAATAQTLADAFLQQVVRTKQTIVFEGPGVSYTERQKLTAFARKHGYETLFIWVQVDPSTAKYRATKGTRQSKSDALLSQEEFTKQAKRLDAFKPTENYIVISGKHTYASQAKNVLKRLSEPRAVRTPLVPEPRSDATKVSSRPSRIKIK